MMSGTDLSIALTSLADEIERNADVVRAEDICFGCDLQLTLAVSKGASISSLNILRREFETFIRNAEILLSGGAAAVN